MTSFAAIQQIARPKRVAQMPQWPGARMAVRLAIVGVREDPPLAVGIDFPDGSSMAVEYQLHRQHDVPPAVYGELGDPPLLSIVVIDNGVAIRKRSGLTERTDAHDAERALAEIQKLLGADRPLAIIGASIDENATRRRYWWRLD